MQLRPDGYCSASAIEGHNQLIQPECPAPKLQHLITRRLQRLSTVYLKPLTPRFIDPRGIVLSQRNAQPRFQRFAGCIIER